MQSGIPPMRMGVGNHEINVDPKMISTSQTFKVFDSTPSNHVI